MTRRSVKTALVLAAFCVGCDDSPTAPSRDAILTFAVENETFHVQLTSNEQLVAARAAQAGGAANIPIGRIVSGTQVNRGWSWHLEDLAFVETTIEVCDGRPSDVERQGAGFGDGPTPVDGPHYRNRSCSRIPPTKPVPPTTTADRDAVGAATRT